MADIVKRCGKEVMMKGILNERFENVVSNFNKTDGVIGKFDGIGYEMNLIVFDFLISENIDHEIDRYGWEAGENRIELEQ